MLHVFRCDRFDAGRLSLLIRLYNACNVALFRLNPYLRCKCRIDYSGYHAQPIASSYVNEEKNKSMYYFYILYINFSLVDVHAFYGIYTSIFPLICI